jgi:thioredoxin 1
VAILGKFAGSLLFLYVDVVKSIGWSYEIEDGHMKLRFPWVRVAIIVFFAVLIGFAVLQSQTTTLKPQGDEASGAPLRAADPQQAGDRISTGRVTLIDLGASGCVPCKMMAPILEELKQEYEGRADIIFIDVWKDPSQARKYKIRAIPTQIFYDAEGNEVFRHTGFMDKKRIVDMLTRLGVT